MKYLPVPGGDDPVQAQPMSLGCSQRLKTVAAFPHYLWVGQSPSCVKSQQQNPSKQNKPEQKWSCHWHERDLTSVSQMTSHGWTLQTQALPSSPHQCCQEQHFPAGVPFFFIQEVNAILVWGWLLGYKCINFLRRCKVKTNAGSCKNLCSWLTESGHCCHPVLLSLLSQVVTDPPRHEVAAVCSFTVLLLPCPGPWRLIMGPESRALGSPGLCKVLQLHVLSASGRFKQQR